MSHEMGTQAKVLAIAVSNGLASREQAVAWADAQIVQAESPSQSLIDASMCGRDVNVLISALNSVADEVGTGAPLAVWQAVLAYASDHFTRHPEDGPRIAGVLERLAWEPEFPDNVTEEEMLGFDDAYHLAKAGVLFRDEVDAQLREFLSRFDAVDTD